MPVYIVYIKGRGRGLRTQRMKAPNLTTIRKQANQWLEYGSDITVKSPSGKVTNFTVRSALL